VSVSILLADDHAVVRHGLRALLEAEPTFRIVGETNDGLKVADLVEQLKPDVLISDLMMPGLNGLEVTRQVSKRTPRTRIIILSMHANEAYVLAALRHGASGYVLKDSNGADLVQAVREVTTGRRYLSPPLSERAIQTYINSADDSSLDPYEALTNREREVLQLAAEGYSNAEIAERLSISTRTAETHRGNLMRKLDLRSQTELVRYALRRGILPLE
jgi:DNA-binding NarL/FixJ family response regulator